MDRALTKKANKTKNILSHWRRRNPWSSHKWRCGRTRVRQKNSFVTVRSTWFGGKRVDPLSPRTIPPVTASTPRANFSHSHRLGPIHLYLCARWRATDDSWPRQVCESCRNTLTYLDGRAEHKGYFYLSRTKVAETKTTVWSTLGGQQTQTVKVWRVAGDKWTEIVRTRLVKREKVEYRWVQQVW